MFLLFTYPALKNSRFEVLYPQFFPKKDKGKKKSQIKNFGLTDTCIRCTHKQTHKWKALGISCIPIATKETSLFYFKLRVNFEAYFHFSWSTK